MTSIVKLQKNGQLRLPVRMREEIGLLEGDQVQVVMKGNKIILEAAKEQFEDDELTPDQKRRLDARLEEGLADVKAGRVHGPFETPQEMVDFLHAHVKETRRKKKPNSQAR